MSPHDARELIQLWLLANEGTATESQLKTLNDRISADGEARAQLIALANQQGWLQWNAVRPEASGADSVERHSAAMNLDGDLIDSELLKACNPGAFGTRAANRRLRRSKHFPEYAIVAALLVAALLGFVIGRKDSRNAPGANPLAVIEAHPQATMVSGAGCVWGAGGVGAASRGKKFASGDMLQLLEGIAEFNIGPRSDVRLQMEGPTSIVLASDHGISLSYGKIILNAMSYDGRQFPIETAFGRILVDYGAEVGLIVFGSTAEIHCFQGRVTVESPWFREHEGDSAPGNLSTGQSLVLDQIGSPTLQVERAAADKLRFTPQVAMSNDFLSVTPAYVQEVIDSKPVAYWRFEETAGGVVKNEMGSAYQGQVRGTVNWSGPIGNHVIELGLTEDPGSMLVDESWDDVLTGDFSIELWMKPSHHHQGSLVGFVGAFDPKLRKNTHGVLLEIAGPIHFGPSRINRLRFLHRSPLSAVPTKDATCFSQKTYSARRWQHVVATKEGDKLHLFVDGALVTSSEIVDPTPLGLQLVVGQLYTDSLDRFFVGQLDEIAIYDRALSPSEAARHHDLLRPSARNADEVL